MRWSRLTLMLNTLQRQVMRCVVTFEKWNECHSKRRRQLNSTEIQADLTCPAVLMARMPSVDVLKAVAKIISGETVAEYRQVADSTSHRYSWLYFVTTNRMLFAALT